MIPLSIDIQAGFEDDLVVVRVNGREVLRQEGVTTAKLYGLAHHFEVPVEEGPVTVEVTLPLRKLSQTLSLQLTKPAYVGVWLDETGLDVSASGEPFAYL